jgi:hypothetical protein
MTMRGDWSKECRCYSCLKASGKKDPCGFVLACDNTFIACETCGNKRCPHATDHRLACTGSNEPGQPGSRYGGIKEDGK